MGSRRTRITQRNPPRAENQYNGNSAFPGSPPGTGRAVRRAAVDRYLAEQATAGAKAPTAKATAGRAPKPTPKVSDMVGNLKALHHIPNIEITLAGAMHPAVMRAAFGDRQLRAAMEQHSLSKLRAMAAAAGLPKRGSKEELITRMSTHVQREPVTVTRARVDEAFRRFGGNEGQQHHDFLNAGGPKPPTAPRGAPNRAPRAPRGAPNQAPRAPRGGGRGRRAPSVTGENLMQQLGQMTRQAQRRLSQVGG